MKRRKPDGETTDDSASAAASSGGAFEPESLRTASMRAVIA